MIELQFRGRSCAELKDVAVGVTVIHDGRLFIVTDEIDPNEKSIQCVRLTTGETTWLPRNIVVKRILVNVVVFGEEKELYAEE